MFCLSLLNYGIAYTRYAFFEWGLIFFDVLYDSIAEQEFREAGLQVGRVSCYILYIFKRLSRYHLLAASVSSQQKSRHSLRMSRLKWSAASARYVNKKRSQTDPLNIPHLPLKLFLLKRRLGIEMHKGLQGKHSTLESLLRELKPRNMSL